MNNSKKHYWDDRFKRQTMKILPGEFYVSNGNDMIVTVLGSCVSACIQDNVNKVGGMNHFMLPMDKSYNITRSLSLQDDTSAARYGNVAMERLINDIMKLGGNRKNMKAKIFGGGRITRASTDIGAGNIDFVRKYLSFEGIQIVSEDVGDTFPRKVYYIPETNEVYVKKIERINNNTIVEREKSYITTLKESETEGEVFFL